MEANLEGAKLQEAKLFAANHTRADLTKAAGIPLTTADAIWGNTTCPDGTNSDTNNPSSCD